SLAARSIVRSLARTTKTLTLSLHDALPILVEFPAPIQRQIKRKMVSVAFKGNDLVSQVGQTDPETVEIAGAIDPSKTEMQDVGIVKIDSPPIVMHRSTQIKFVAQFSPGTQAQLGHRSIEFSHGISFCIVSGRLAECSPGKTRRHGPYRIPGHQSMQSKRTNFGREEGRMQIYVGPGPGG